MRLFHFCFLNSNISHAKLFVWHSNLICIHVYFDICKCIGQQRKNRQLLIIIIGSKSFSVVVRMTKVNNGKATLRNDGNGKHPTVINIFFLSLHFARRNSQKPNRQTGASVNTGVVRILSYLLEPDAPSPEARIQYNGILRPYLQIRCRSVNMPEGCISVRYAPKSGSRVLGRGQFLRKGLMSGKFCSLLRIFFFVATQPFRSRACYRALITLFRCLTVGFINSFIVCLYFNS